MNPALVGLTQGYPLTTTTSYCLAVGGKPVSNLAFTTANRRPKRAAVVGTWNRSLVMTFSTTPEVRLGRSRILVTWVVLHRPQPPALSTMPSTWGRLIPAMAALAPLVGSTVYSWPCARVGHDQGLARGRGPMPLRLKSLLRLAAGPLSASVLDGPRAPDLLTGTK